MGAISWLNRMLVVTGVWDQTLCVHAITTIQAATAATPGIRKRATSVVILSSYANIVNAIAGAVLLPMSIHLPTSAYARTALALTFCLVALTVGVTTGRGAAVAGALQQDRIVWFCPMHHDITSPQPGRCSLCQMALVSGNPLDTQEYALELATVPAAVKAGVPFAIDMTVMHPVTERVIQSFEEVHDKRYHLFIISQDMSVFEHVHPEQRPNGTWRFEATLPKPGYYTLLSDFMPTGGSPQFVTRRLITSDFTGHIDTAAPALTPDRDFTKTVDSLTATVTFDPLTLVPGEHGHLRFQLTDAATKEPVVDLQPYLGAFGHTLIMGEQTLDAVHSHPTPGESDVTTGAGGPRVTFEGYFPVAGNYRAWTQFVRGGKLSTFTFTFRVPSPDEAIRRP
jgi:hypothetical protein